MTITSFFDSSRFDSSRQPWEVQSPEILTQSRDGLINGIKAGPFDECFSRTHLPDDSLIYKTGGGYLWAVAWGWLRGVASLFMNGILMTNTGLKSCHNALFPKEMMASALPGRVVNAVCATSYLIIRLIEQKAFPLPPAQGILIHGW